MAEEKEAFLKVVVLGESDGEKTALLTRWCTGQYIEKAKKTRGVEFFIKTVLATQQKIIRLQLWNVASDISPKKSLEPYCYENTSMVLLLWPAQQDYLECLKKYELLNSPIVIVQSAADSSSNIKQWADSHGLTHYKIVNVSAAKNIGFEQLTHAVNELFKPLSQFERFRTLVKNAEFSRSILSEHTQIVLALLEQSESQQAKSVFQTQQLQKRVNDTLTLAERIFSHGSASVLNERELFEGIDQNALSEEVREIIMRYFNLYLENGKTCVLQ